MTDKQTPPEWAFKRAQKLREQRGFTHLDAFAAYIAEHEQPPKDRKLLCAERSMWEWAQTTDEIGQEWIAIRAIELWEEGFGK